MDTDDARLLEYLRDGTDTRKMVHDETDDRWFVYAFESDPPEVTDVRKDVAGRLLEAGWIEDRGDDARVDFPGSDYRVFRLTDDGARALDGSGG